MPTTTADLDFESDGPFAKGELAASLLMACLAVGLAYASVFAILPL